LSKDLEEERKEVIHTSGQSIQAEERTRVKAQRQSKRGMLPKQEGGLCVGEE
jgi:hypothetical protein